MANPFISEIRMVGFNFPPRGWATCDGQLINISQNTALFSLLGVNYGGDGRTTFGVPDFRGRFPIHWGQGPGLSPYDIGEQGGEENVTLIATELPAHNHGGAPAGLNTVGTATTLSGNCPARPVGNARFVNVYSNAAGDTLLGNALAPAGDNQPHNNLMPLLCVNFVICLQGVFPSRG